MEEGKRACLHHHSVHRHDDPQVIIGMDRGNRVKSLHGEKVMIGVTIAVLLAQKQLDFVLRPVWAEWHHRKNILRGIAVPHVTEGSRCVVGDIS